MLGQRRLIICLIGPQGSGKDTQAEFLSHFFKLRVLVLGQLFRDLMAKKTKVGKIAGAFINQGKLVPNTITNKLIKETLQKASYRKGVIINGYPRNTNQAAYLDSFLTSYLVLYIGLSDIEAIKRLSERRVCANGHTYHIMFKPPKKKGICDKDALPLTIREDDYPEAIKKRLAIYRQRTEPVLKRYLNKKMLITINGNQSIEEVSHEIARRLQGYVSPKKQRRNS